MEFKQFLEQSYGIITAHNPGGVRASKQKNDRLNKELRDDLKGYKIKETEGTYRGMKEDSFKVYGITKQKLVDLARKYDQNSVIWVQGRESSRIVI